MEIGHRIIRFPKKMPDQPIREQTEITSATINHLIPKDRGGMNRKFPDHHSPIINPTRLGLAKRGESSKTAGCREYRAIGLNPILCQYLKSPSCLLINGECRCPKRPHLLAYDILYGGKGAFQIPAKKSGVIRFTNKCLSVWQAISCPRSWICFSTPGYVRAIQPKQKSRFDTFLVQEIQDFR